MKLSIPRLTILVAVFFGCVAYPALADEVMVYDTRISEEDIYNSSGKKLTTIAEIIQQDRANVHKFGNPDGDYPDDVFGDPNRRAEIPEFIKRAGQEIPSSLKKAILAGNAKIFVSYNLDINGKGFLLIEKAN